MACFTKILAVLDTGQEDDVVFEQALQLARACKAELTLLDIVPELGWTVRWAVPNHQEMQEAMAEKKQAALDKLTESIDDIPVKTEVACGRTSALIIDRVMEGNYDLTIKMARGRFSKRPGPIGVTGMRLVRKCPGTVWLVAPDAQNPPRKVMATVDATPHDQEHARLNTRILDWATLLRDKIDCDMHVVHAWNIYGENLLREHMNAEEFEQMIAKAEDEHVATFCDLVDPLDLAKDGRLDADHAHLVRGDAAYVIPQVVSENDIDLLVMGTVARTGVRGLLLGNTAETILNRVACSVIAIKPEGYVSPMTLESNSATE